MITLKSLEKKLADAKASLNQHQQAAAHHRQQADAAMGAIHTLEDMIKEEKAAGKPAPAKDSKAPAVPAQT